jgi:hypothetical protein
MFKVNQAEWESLSEDDRKAVRNYRKEWFPKLEHHCEALDLPSGKVFIIFADGRGFFKEGNQCTRTA